MRRLYILIIVLLFLCMVVLVALFQFPQGVIPVAYAQYGYDGIGGGYGGMMSASYLMSAVSTGSYQTMMNTGYGMASTEAGMASTGTPVSAMSMVVGGGFPVGEPSISMSWWLNRTGFGGFNAGGATAVDLATGMALYNLPSIYPWNIHSEYSRITGSFPYWIRPYKYPWEELPYTLEKKVFYDISFEPPPLSPYVWWSSPAYPTTW